MKPGAAEPWTTQKRTVRADTATTTSAGRSNDADPRRTDRSQPRWVWSPPDEWETRHRPRRGQAFLRPMRDSAAWTACPAREGFLHARSMSRGARDARRDDSEHHGTPSRGRRILPEGQLLDRLVRLRERAVLARNQASIDARNPPRYRRAAKAASVQDLHISVVIVGDATDGRRPERRSKTRPQLDRGSRRQPRHVSRPVLRVLERAPIVGAIPSKSPNESGSTDAVMELVPCLQ